jgi:LmbE family N-acetylglucosaminyl deacetylase
VTTIVLSPHTDDAVFSIGDHLCSLETKTVVAPMAAIPADAAGKVKHETLHGEHAEAMAIIGVDHVNGPFFDDVYPAPDPGIFAAWLSLQLADADTVYVPVGIRHIDHLIVSNAAIAYLLTNDRPAVRFYAELPYRTRYPGLFRDRLDFIHLLFGELKAVDCVSAGPGVKEAALRAYASQTDEDLIRELLAPELIWEVS